jgi:uncharacterized membrane protein
MFAINPPRLPMTRMLVAYAATLVVFCCCDFVWLGWIAKDYYQSQLGGMLLAQPNWGAAVAFYALYAAGVVLFCIAPALEAAALVKAALLGALLGALAYATYDLSNLATLKGWPVALALVDIAWGAFVTALAATAGYQITRWSGVTG